MNRHTNESLTALLRRSRGRTDRIPLTRRQELSLFREVYRSWREIGKLEGERELLRVNLRQARRKK